jgi:hypothetical protein
MGSASSATTGSSARPTEVPLPATAASTVATSSVSAAASVTATTTASSSSASSITTETFGSGGSGAQGFLAMVVVFKIDRNRLSEQAFDRSKVFLFLTATEGYGRTVGTGSSRASDAVDIGFRFYGKIVVDYVGDVVDVETPGRDVGCYKYSVVTVLEPVERLGAGRLAFVAVNGGPSNAN